MKKIFSLIIAFVMMITLANAQTVESSRLFENTYVTVLGGATTTGQFNQVPTPFFWDGAKGIANGVRPFAGLELGKYVTPVVGFSVEGLAFYKTTTSYTFIDESVVLANGKLNFSNWFGGYKGQPRRVEVVGVLGMGWGHDYVAGSEGQTWTSRPGEGLEEVVGTNVYEGAPTVKTDKDYVVYNAGAEFNVNLGKARAWQVSVRPGVMWFNKYMKNQYQSLPRFMSDARANVQVGVTYKFGSKRKGGAHNFVLCPYSVTQEDYDALQAKYDELANRPPVEKEVVKTVTETKEVTKVVETKVLVGSTIITFPIGSWVLSNVEKAKVEAFAKSLDDDTLIQLVGSADSKTGTASRNTVLAENRANVVKNTLVEFGVSADRIYTDTQIDATGNVNTDRSVIISYR